MKTRKALNHTTKQAQNYIKAFRSPYARASIFQMYSNPSNEKIDAYLEIRERAKAETNSKFTSVYVISSSSFTFSTAYLNHYDANGNKTLVVDTKTYTYDIVLPKDIYTFF